MSVEAEKVGGRIYVRSSSPLYGLRDALPGAYWSKRARAWTFALSMDSCRAIRAYFGRNLRIGPELWAWAKAEVAREDSQRALGKSLTGVQLKRAPKVAPRIASAMASRPYQAAAARFGAEGRAVLIADTPGLGKTLEAIGAVVESGVPGPYLVVAPKTSLDVVWEREISAWLGDSAYVAVIDGSRPERNVKLWHAMQAGERVWVIINIEMARTKSFWICPECKAEFKVSDRPKSSIISCGHSPDRVKTRHEHEYAYLFDIEWGAIIADECQRSLIRTTGTPTQTRAGMLLLKTRQDGLRIALSGTPMRGKPQRLWGTLNWLRPQVYRSYWNWVQLYWKVDKNLAWTVGELNADRESDLYKALDSIMIRRTKAEVSPELPPKEWMGQPLNGDFANPDTANAIWLKMEPKQAKAYAEMAKYGSAQVDGGNISAVGVLAELTRLKQFANCYGAFGPDKAFRPALPSNKFDWLVQFLTDRSIIDPDDKPTGKVVVVSQFTQVLNTFRSLLEGMGVKTLAITGEITGKHRESAVDRFNDMNSGYNVLFINTMAGGVAITLDAADDMVFIDETHVPDDQEQTEDRINNRRPEEKVAVRRYWYLKSLGTVDEWIAQVNFQADKQQKGLLDGRRGVDYMHALEKGLKI